MIDEATNVAIWAKHAKGRKEEATFSDSASSKDVRFALTRGGKLDGDQKTALSSAATGGQWCSDRHLKAEHVDSNLCLLCKSAVGTEWHRVYKCPLHEPIRRDHLDDAIRREAAPHEAPTHDRWTRGHLPLSALPVPPPQPTSTVCNWTRGVAGEFTGEVYLDGSASRPTRTEYSVNACSVVAMEVYLGRPRLALQLNVELTSGLDGPEAAEIGALEWLLQHCILPVKAWTDCQNVIDSFSKGRAHCTSLGHAQAEHWRRVFAKLDDHGPTAADLVTLVKVKAHCTAQLRAV